MTIGNKTKKRLIVVMVVFIVSMVYLLNPYRIQYIGHYDKTWAHRVNSIEKLESAMQYFNGVELDLVYDSITNNFDVNHPPAMSIGLNFETYLSTINTPEKPFLWLDIKNLTLQNVEHIYSKLTNLTATYNYPSDKILVETRYPETLPKFTHYGFMTSYYLDSKIKKIKDDAAKAEAVKIKNILEHQPEIGISSSYLGYDFMLEYFPEKTKYVWILTPRIHSDFFKIRRILNDTTVKAVLVNYKAPKGNR